MARAFHKKLHACVLGTLQIDNSKLPEQARVGLFAKNTSHPVWMRLSSGQSNRAADRKADARGLSLKILGVEGERVVERAGDETATTQDFLMFNHSIAPAADVRHLMAFSQAVTNAPDARNFLGKISNLLGAFDILARDEYVRTVDFLLNRVVPKAKRHGSLLAEEFFTGVPNALGLEAGDALTARAKGAMKVRATTGLVQGGRCEPKPAPPGSSEGFLREDFERAFASADVCVQLSLQLQKDPVWESIEDGSVDWQTEFVPWGMATFSAVDESTTQERAARCERFAFTPWHTLTAHRPLGNMMRARRVVLAASQKPRGADAVEPRAEDAAP